jgi:hypothetical protein
MRGPPLPLRSPYPNPTRIVSADFLSLAETEERIAEPVPKRKRGISLLATAK